MAIAGYDPNEAVGLWERMKQVGSGSEVPEFMSTHPSDQHRIDDIKKYLPQAMKYYKKQRQIITTTVIQCICIGVRQGSVQGTVVLFLPGRLYECRIRKVFSINHDIS